MSRVLFVAQDPGAVKVLTPVIEKMTEPELSPGILVCAKTQKICLEEGINPDFVAGCVSDSEREESVSKVLKDFRPKVVVTGASRPQGGMTLEQFAILAARKSGAHSVCILDYWGDYRDRFSFLEDGELVQIIPDTVCALDKSSSAKVIESGVPPERIIITYNPRFDEFSFNQLPASNRRIPENKELRLLYVSQPLSSRKNIGALAYDQEAGFRALVKTIQAEESLSGCEITVWIHPNDKGSCWVSLLNELAVSGIDIKVDNERARNALSRFDLVASGYSTMLYEAVLRGIPSVSLLFGLQGSDQLITNELRLSRVFYTEESLRKFFLCFNLATEKNILEVRKREVAAEGLFFSDGGAVSRIKDVILDCCNIREINRIKI